MKHWVDTLKPGDVVRMKRGALRTVLTATYKADGRIAGATFAIMRCSWTRRPYTAMNRSDLKILGLCKTIARVNLANYPVALRAAADRGLRGSERTTFCCDVIGVFT